MEHVQFLLIDKSYGWKRNAEQKAVAGTITELLKTQQQRIAEQIMQEMPAIWQVSINFETNEYKYTKIPDMFDRAFNYPSRTDFISITAVLSTTYDPVPLRLIVLLVPFPWFARWKKPKKKRQWFGGEKMRSREELKPFIEEYRKKYSDLGDKVLEAKTHDDLEKISDQWRAIVDEIKRKFTEKENHIIINELSPISTAFSNLYHGKKHQLIGTPLIKF